MTGANVMFHLAALLGIAWLGLLVAKFTADRQLLRRLLREPERLTIAPPVQFAIRLASLLGITWIGELRKHEPPKRVRGRVVLDFLVRYRIKEVRIETEGLLFILMDPNVNEDDMKQWHSTLSEALQCSVVLRKDVK